MNLQKQDKNSRMSSLPYRQGMIVPKEKDPRPIGEKNFQSESCKKIINYLITHNYESEVSNKILMNLSQKDFTGIFCFLLNKLRPDFQYNLKKIDEDVPLILIEIKYPFNISKHSLVSFGTNTSVAPIIAMFLWIVEILVALEESQIEEEVETDNEYEKLEIEYINMCYDHYLKTGDKEHFDLTEKFNQNVAKIKDRIDQNCLNMNEEMNLTITKVDDLKNNSPDIYSLKKQKDSIIKEHESLLSKISINDNLITSKKIEFNLKIQNFSQKTDKINETNSILQDLEKTAKEQIISFDEYEKLKQLRINYEKQISALQTKKQELVEIEWKQSNEIETLLLNLNEKKKSLFNLNEKIKSNLNNGESELMIFNFSIDTYVNLISNMGFEIEKTKEDFINISKEINEKLKNLSNSIRDKEEELLKINSEIVKLDDKIIENTIILSNKNTESERVNNNHKLKKEKYMKEIKETTSFNHEFNNEIEMFKLEILKNKKEYEQLKNTENELNNLNQKKDEEMKKFINEIENDLKETIEEVCKYKGEFLKNLRKASKNISSFKQKMMSGEN